MADNPQLVVAITASLDKFEKQLKEAGLLAQREVDKIESTMTRASAAGAFLGNIFSKALTEGASAFVDSLKQAHETLLAMGETAERTKLSFEELQRIRAVARSGGLSDKEFTEGANKLADKLDEMNRKETALSRFLDQNNIKYKERTGLVIDTSKAMTLVNQLFQNASSLTEKIEIGRLFGLTEQWVRALDKAPAALQQIKDKATIDKDLENAVRQARILQQVFVDIIQLLTDRITTIGTTIATNLVSAFEVAFAKLVEILKAVGDAGGEATAGWLKVYLDRAEKLHGIMKRAREDLERPGVTVKPTGAGFNWSGGAQEAALVRAHDQLLKNLELQKEELRTIEMSVGKQEEAKQLALLRAAAIRDGLDPEKAITEEMKKQAALSGIRRETIVETKAHLQELVSASKEFGATLADAFKGLVLEGKKLDEVLKNVANRLASRSIDKMFDLMFAATTGTSTTTPFLNLLKGLQGRAAGGPVHAGSPYMVGERGAELFVPNRSGMIVPNSATRGGAGGVTYAPINNIDARGSTMGEAQFKAMLAANNRQMLQAVSAAAPGRQRRLAMLGT